jgi:hypothetical protein
MEAARGNWGHVAANALFFVALLLGVYGIGRRYG